MVAVYPKKRAQQSLLQAARASVESLENRVLLSVPTTWTQEGNGGGGTFFNPSFNPANPQEVYVTTDMTPMFHSTNLGNSWAALNWTNFEGGRGTHISFTSNPQDLYGLSNSPMKSTNAGVTWQNMGSFSGYIYDVYADPNSSSRVVVVTGTNIYLSTNSGSSFTSEYSTSNLYAAGAFFSTTNNSIYIGTNKGLLLSTSNGAFSVQGSAAGRRRHALLHRAQDPNTGTIRLLCATDLRGINRVRNRPVCRRRQLHRPLHGNRDRRRIQRMGVGDDGHSLGQLRLSRLLCQQRHQRPLGCRRRTRLAIPFTAAPTAAPSWTETFQNNETGFTKNQNIYTGWSGDGGHDYGFGEPTAGLEADPANASYAAISDMGFVYITSDAGNTWHAVYEYAASQNAAGSNASN